MALPKTVHLVRLGTAAAPLSRYLRGHEDAVSWTADVALAIPFLSADAARRYAARRLGGAWHVEEVDRAIGRFLVPAGGIDVAPEQSGTDPVEVSARSTPEGILVPRERGLRMEAARRAVRAGALARRVAA